MPQFLSTAPSGNILSVTPSDTVDLAPGATYAPACRGISIGVLGTLRIITATGQTVDFASGELLVGVIYGLSATRIKSAGTTATSIKAYY